MIPNKEYERITKEAMKGTDDIDKVHLAIEETYKLCEKEHKKFIINHVISEIVGKR